MASYEGFDGITEPGRGQRLPYFMRATRTRRNRTLFLVGAVFCMIALLTWGTTSKVKLCLGLGTAER